MRFTPEFERELRSLYTELERTGAERAGEFLTAVQDLRDRLESAETHGEFYTVTSDGTVLHSHPVFFDYRLIFTIGADSALVWIEKEE